MTNYCDKCKVEVDISHKNCPLCGAYVERDEIKNKSVNIKDIDYSYPAPNTETVIKKLLFKIILLFCIISVGVVMVVDSITSVRLDWSFHILVGWLIFWFTIGRSIFFHLEFRRQIVWDTIFACFLCLYIQYNLSNIDDWAWTYAVPAVLLGGLAALCLMMIAQYKNWENYCLPTTVMCILTTVPMIAYAAIYHVTHFMHYITIGCGLIVLLTMMIFGKKKYFLEIKKKFHI